MSLVKLALRVAAVEALKGATLVGEQVLDSEIGAIDLASDGSLESGQEKRFVAVYTGSAKTELAPHQPRALYGGGTCELIFEVGITASMMTRDAETGNQEVIEGVPATDAAFEFYLDVVDRQIVDALIAGPGDWADIWRSLVHRVVSVERLRTDSAGQVRLAGHQLKLVCEIADDPVPGDAYDAEGPFGRFMAALEASVSEWHQSQLAVVSGVLGESGAEDWALIARQLGLTQAELLAMGRGPLSNDEDRETPAAGTATLDVEGAGETDVTSDGEA